MANEADSLIRSSANFLIIAPEKTRIVCNAPGDLLFAEASHNPNCIFHGKKSRDEFCVVETRFVANARENVMQSS